MRCLSVLDLVILSYLFISSKGPIDDPFVDLLSFAAKEKNKQIK